MIHLEKRRTAKTSSHSHSVPKSLTNEIKDDDPNNKSKHGPIKVMLSILGVLFVLFLMFSVFQPKKTRPPDRPPLKVYYDKQKFEQQHSGHLSNHLNNEKNLNINIDISDNEDYDDIKNEQLEQINNILMDTDDYDDEVDGDNSNSISIDIDNKEIPSISKEEIPRLIPIAKPQLIEDYDDPDIEFLDSGTDQEQEQEIEIDSLNNDIPDLYLIESYPPRPPQSIHIGGLSFADITELFTDSLASDDIFSSSTLPSLDSFGHIYVMNYIYLPYEQMMSIFLLTSEYLDPNHGLHSWPNKQKRSSMPELYKNIRNTIYKDYKLVSPEFACIFKIDHEDNINDNDADNNHNIWVSPVDFVPNNTTRDRYVNYGTEILRCNIPMNEMNKYYNKYNMNAPWYDEEYNFKFLFTQKWKDLLPKTDVQHEDANVDDTNLVHTLLTFPIGMRSGIHLHSHSPSFILNKANQNRYLTLCMPPMTEPLSFLTENIAHYISNIGIEHIYIGTFFEWNIRDDLRDKLIDKIQPYYDRGLITIWPHEQQWISFTDKAKSHWLNQCLYYVKSRDSYTLSLDTDEFIVLNDIENIYNNTQIDEIEIENFDDELELDDNHDKFVERRNGMQSVLHNMVRDRVSSSEFGDDHYCWISFQSYQMWQLLNPSENYMIRRFIGRESKAQMTWSKVIWNNQHLWFTGYHAGGACSAQHHDWKLIIYDWREQIDRKHVYRFDPEQEGALFHYYNCRKIRIEPKEKNARNPWSKTTNDTRMMNVYWDNIYYDFKKYKLKPTYPDNVAIDVMKTKYYLQHYGEGKSMINYIP